MDYKTRKNCTFKMVACAWGAASPSYFSFIFFLFLNPSSTGVHLMLLSRRLADRLSTAKSNLIFHLPLFHLPSSRLIHFFKIKKWGPQGLFVRHFQTYRLITFFLPFSFFLFYHTNCTSEIFSSSFSLCSARHDFTVYSNRPLPEPYGVFPRLFPRS